MAILGAPIFELPIKQFLMRDYMMIRQVVADYSEDEQQKIREHEEEFARTFHLPAVSSAQASAQSLPELQLL